MRKYIQTVTMFQVIIPISASIMKKIILLYFISFNAFAACDYLKFVEKHSNEFGFNPDFVLSVIQAESNFNCDAVSNKKAKGLMQLIDITANKFGVIDPFNADDNIRGGVNLLSELSEKYSDIDYVLAAYNAGETAVNKYDGVPPYNETKNYIKKIKTIFLKRTKTELTIDTAKKISKLDPNNPWVRFRVQSAWKKFEL